MSFLYAFFDSVFGPVLNMNSHTTGALLAVFILDVVFAFLLAIIYKYLMNQKEAKKLKANIKELKKKVNEAKKSNDINKMNQFMRKSVEMNNKLLRMSLKPMLASMVLVFLVFPWVNYTFSPTISFKNVNGTYTGQLKYDNLTVPLKLNSSNLIAFGTYGIIGRGQYIKIDDTKWQVKSISFSRDKKTAKSKVALVFVNLPFYIPFAGRTLEWFGYYFLLGIPLTYGFRKLFKVA